MSSLAQGQNDTELFVQRARLDAIEEPLARGAGHDVLPKRFNIFDLLFDG
jgi:hypothetical protein